MSAPACRLARGQSHRQAGLPSGLAGIRHAFKILVEHNRMIEDK